MSIGARLFSGFRLQGAMGAVARNLGWLLASRGVVAILSLFYIGFATRSLGVKDFGRFALVSGASQALATLVAFQTWQIIVRYGVEALAQNDQARLGRLFRLCAALDMGSALVGTGLAIVILEYWGEALGIGPTLLRATLIFTMIQLLTIRSTPTGILRLRDRFSSAAIADSVTPVMRFVGAALAMWFHPTVQGFLFAWGLAELATALTYWAMIVRGGDWRLFVGRGWLDWRRAAAENPGLTRFALSINANSTLNLSSKQVPLLVIGAFVGTSSAGIFRLTAQLAQALAKLSQMLSRAAFAEVVRMVERASITRLLRRMALGSALGSLVIMGVVVIIGRQALETIGGPGFGVGYPVLIALSAAGCIELIIVGVETVMTANGGAHDVFVARGIAVAAMALAALWLVPALGSLGMALAVLLGSVGAGLMLLTRLRRVIVR
jgi:O-antigen/teichoic acid export membrane protein